MECTAVKDNRSLCVLLATVSKLELRGCKAFLHTLWPKGDLLQKI